MNELTNQKSTMSSKEIAELTGIRHDSVKRTMETLVKAGLINVTQIVEDTGYRNQKVEISYVNERDSYVVVARVSPEATAKLVDRWMELERLVNEQAFQLPDFNDPIASARAWADEVEQKQLLQTKQIEDAPKVDYADTVMESKGSLNLTETAKSMNLKPNKFIQFLKDTNRIYKQGDHNLPMQGHVNSGVFEVKTVRRGNHGLTTQTFVTGKGQVLLRKLVVNNMLKGKHIALIGSTLPPLHK